MQVSLTSQIRMAVERRSHAAVDVLLRDARPTMYRLALAIVGRPDTAEDVTQEALIRASRSREKLRTVAEPAAWLRAIVVRCALTALARPRFDSQQDVASDADPTEAMAVRMTLERLNPIDRAVLALVHFEGLTYGEIALALDIPVGTVASRLHNAREAFRKEWRK